MLLSLTIFLPLIGALIVLTMRNDYLVRISSLVFSLLSFIFSLSILSGFDKTVPSLQMIERYEWVNRFGISYFLGIDGISLWLVLLTTFFLPIMILASWNSVTSKVKMFHISLFILQTSLLGTFLSIDMVLFYVFFEISLVPMYFLIGIWGSGRRLYSSIKLFIFTMFGSVFLLFAIIYMMFLTMEQQGSMSASLLDFYQVHAQFMDGGLLSPQVLLFMAFSIAFAVKVPIFPFHTWLPDAHVDAPTSGSVVLAAIMLKMGTYGFIRFCIPLFPEAVAQYSWIFLVLGVIGIIYGALVAMVQPDVKKLVAYSSVSHMGYVMLGLFALNTYGVMGGLLQMLNHGISTGALFLLVGMIYERTHSREIAKYGGLASSMPIYAIFFFIITLSSIAVPLTNGFVGEFMILLGIFAKAPVFAVIAVLGVIFGAVYMLWMFKRVFFGVESNLVKGLKDISLREYFVIVPLTVLVFWIGIRPNHFMNWSKASLEHLVNNQTKYSLPVQSSLESKINSTIFGAQ